MYTNINLYILFIVLFLLFYYYLVLSLQCPVVLGFHILSYLNNRDIDNNYITKILRKLNYMSSANSLGISLTHNWLSLCMCICVSVCVCIDICCLLHLTVLCFADIAFLQIEDLRRPCIRQVYLHCFSSNICLLMSLSHVTFW